MRKNKAAPPAERPPEFQRHMQRTGPISVGYDRATGLVTIWQKVPGIANRSLIVVDPADVDWLAERIVAARERRSL